MHMLKLAGRCAIVATLAVAFAAHSQTTAPAAKYPTRPVKLVVPFSPGGATDVIARVLGQKLTELWSQPIIVENRPGATGAIALEFVAKSPPDGYTLLLGTASTHSFSPAITTKLPYDPVSDFAPISLVATLPNMLVVHPSVPANTVAEFIALAKANPGKYNFASSGIGSSMHVAGELFKLMTGTDMTHVPYKGSGAALSDLLAGRVQSDFDSMPVVWPHVQTGQLKALGVASLERQAAAPNVPAIAETVPGFEVNSWIGIFAPAHTPPDILRKVQADMARVATMPEFRQKLFELGATAVSNTPAEFAAFFKKDAEKWRNVVKSAGVTPQ
jgi:tripartite-type tricarboxylate transporter receptor subunit TctC